MYRHVFRGEVSGLCSFKDAEGAVCDQPFAWEDHLTPTSPGAVPDAGPQIYEEAVTEVRGAVAAPSRPPLAQRLRDPGAVVPFNPMPVQRFDASGQDWPVLRDFFGHLMSVGTQFHVAAYWVGGQYMVQVTWDDLYGLTCEELAQHAQEYGF